VSELAQYNESALLMPVATPEKIIDAHKAAVDIVTKVLEEGTDYGVVPGTGNRPALFKAGAERLCHCYGLSIHFEVIDQECDHDRENFYTDKYRKRQTSEGLYRFAILCRLTHRSTGQAISEAIGTCSTMESKYISRPRDCENTVIKMAQKRALVAASLHAFGLSDRFTQDVEDIHANAKAAGVEPEPHDPDRPPTRPKGAPQNYMTVDRHVTTPEHKIADKCRERLGFTKEQFVLLRAYSTPIDVRFVLNEAYYRGYTTVEQVLDLVKVPGADSPDATHTDGQGTIDAEIVGETASTPSVFVPESGTEAKEYDPFEDEQQPTGTLVFQSPETVEAVSSGKRQPKVQAA
jgi:hypothetical protein